jgi:hypothetical protein
MEIIAIFQLPSIEAEPAGSRLPNASPKQPIADACSNQPITIAESLVGTSVPVEILHREYIELVKLSLVKRQHRDIGQVPSRDAVTVV